ncbi:MAG: hypothetical protein AAF485_09575, partial [Chloroflexota bacterium]
MLLDINERGRAARELMKVVRSDASVRLRVEAVRLLEGTGDDTFEDELFGVLDDALDPRLRAAVGRALWRLLRDL